LYLGGQEDEQDPSAKKKITIFNKMMGHINDFTVKKYEKWHPKNLEHQNLTLR
jgi:hypothetical protein